MVSHQNRRWGEMSNQFKWIVTKDSGKAPGKGSFAALPVVVPDLNGASPLPTKQGPICCSLTCLTLLNNPGLAQKADLRWSKLRLLASATCATN